LLHLLTTARGTKRTYRHDPVFVPFRGEEDIE
jgi:hypothetical protein